MTLVMGWLARNRFKARPQSDAWRLVHSTSTLALGIVCFAFFAGIAVVSNVYPNRTTTWWTTTLFVGFALMAVPMIADYFLARHDVSESGISYGRLTGRRGNLKWSELRSVRYAPVMKWFRLESRSGQVARISAMLMGLPEFARLVLQHAPAEAIESSTKPILEATASGYPPPIW